VKRAAALTITLCIGVWVVARWVIFDYFQLGDTRVYEHAARMMDAGAIPYRDFDVEYPPLATGLFWLVGRAPGGDYQLAFSMTMLACLIAAALAALFIARRLGLSRVRTVIVVAVIALTPLLLGTLVQTRYDLVLSALLGWVLVAALHDRFKWAWALLAIATAVKLIPVLLVPALVLWHRHRRSGRQALVGATGFAAVVAATFAPFFAIAPHATWRLFAYHLDRPPEVESLGSSVLNVTNLGFRRVQSYGSENLTGTWPDAFASLSTLLIVLSVAAVALWMWRALRRGSGDVAGVLVAAVAASLVASVLLGKVISPQYMVWLLPAVLLVPGKWGRVAIVSMIVAMPLTQLVFPALFATFVERGAALPAWLLFARNLLLVLLVVAVWPRCRDTPSRAADAFVGEQLPAP
jgi:uncharacterized membrane protein